MRTTTWPLIWNGRRKLRSHANCRHRDAINLVAREMQRRGQNLTCWREKDADAAREIAEILNSLDLQAGTTSDPAFAG